MRDIKFRGRTVKDNELVYGYYFESEDKTRTDLTYNKNYYKDFSGSFIIEKKEMNVDCCMGGGYVLRNIFIQVIPESVQQFTGLQDKNGKDIYEGDECRFDNGDTGIVKCEDWLEFYFEWIGEAECEDQSRDFYRLSKSEIIDKEKV